MASIHIGFHLAKAMTIVILRPLSHYNAGSIMAALLLYLF